MRPITKHICLIARDLFVGRNQLKTLVPDFVELTIFAITETWLPDNKDFWTINIEIFEPFRYDRDPETSKKIGGGVIMLFIPERF